jgi:hypothetical protein
MPASAASTSLLALCTALKRLEGAQLVRALSLRVGGVFLESGVAIESSATMIQDVVIAFKAKNFSNANALLGRVPKNHRLPGVLTPRDGLMESEPHLAR